MSDHRESKDGKDRSRAKKRDDKKKKSPRVSTSPRRVSHSPRRSPIVLLSPTRPPSPLEEPSTIQEAPSQWLPVDPRVEWSSLREVDVPQTLDMKIEAMIEKAMSKFTAKLAPPSLPQGRESQVGETSGGVVGTNQTSAHPSKGQTAPRSHPSPPPVKRRTLEPQRMSEIRALGSRPSDGAHVSPLASLPYTQTQPDTPDRSSYHQDEERNPFQEMPGLEDCPLGGLRSALSKPPSSLTTSDHQLALWRQARGGDEVKVVRTNRVDALYSSQDEKASPFIVPELPLTQQQWQNDGAAAACFWSDGSSPVQGAWPHGGALAGHKHMCELIGDEEVRQRIEESVNLIANEALRPVGHSLRFLASGFNVTAYKRKEAAASAVKDTILQQQIRAKALVFTSFFNDNPDQMIAAAATRQQQRALTSAIRDVKQPTKQTQPRRPMDRSLSPLRRDDRRTNFQSQPRRGAPARARGVS